MQLSVAFVLSAELPLQGKSCVPATSINVESAQFMADHQDVEMQPSSSCGNLWVAVVGARMEICK
jgi:hypothetical protein